MQFSIPSFESILEIHKIVLEEHGGLEGVPHPELIESSIMRPQTYMAYDENCDIHLIAAIILHSLAGYHAFADGNKRTALVTMLMTYRLNGVRLEYSLYLNEKFEELVLKVAENKNKQSIEKIRKELIELVEEFSK